MGLSWSKRFGIIQGTCTFDQQNGIAAWGMPGNVEHHPALDPSGRAYSRVGPTTFFLNGGEMPGEETGARLAARHVTIEVANVNLRESCEDDPAAIALMIKNTKSPHFRDALPVLMSRLLLNFVSAVYDLGVPQCLISSSAEISCWRMIPRPCKKRSSCC